VVRTSCTAPTAPVSEVEPYLAGVAVGGRPGVTGTDGVIGSCWSSVSSARAGAGPRRTRQAPPAHMTTAKVIVQTRTRLNAAPTAAIQNLRRASGRGARP
jgi:hypothetical protein